MNFSVLISVYKNENPFYLNKALHSIWTNQTKKPDQIVLVQDGTLPVELLDIIKKWKSVLDNQLTIVSLIENVGLGAALNKGLQFCKHDLVARMDSDDEALPHRFSIQIEFMGKNPSVAASSGLIEVWDERMENHLSTRHVPKNGSELLLYAKKRSPLNHPAVIFRKSIIDSLGGYPEFRKMQDYALWSLMLVNGYILANVDENLLRMRGGRSLMERRGLKHFSGELEVINFQRKIGFLSFGYYLINLSWRGGLRLLPSNLRSVFYKFIK